MSKLSIICPELSYVEIKGHRIPVVILIGRDENGKRKKYRKKVIPYFYISERDYRELKDSSIFNKLKIVKSEGTKVRNINKNVMTKIYMENTDKVEENIKCINRWNEEKDGHSIFTYETDTSKGELLPLRFIIDENIKSGMDITKDRIIPIDFIYPLRKWYIDFEAYSFKTAGLNRDDPINVASVWDSYLSKLYVYYTFNPKWTIEQQCRFIKFIEEYVVSHKELNPEIRQFKTEANLLDALVDLTIELDWDALIAWNLNRYDIEKWKYRMEVNKKECIHRFNDISPLKGILWNSKPHRVKGRILFDLMVAFKQFTDSDFDSYSLEFVIEKEHLPLKKIHFIGSSGNTWDEAPEVLLERNINDVLVIKALDEKYNLVDLYNDNRTEFGTLFHESFVRHRIIDTALLRLVNGKIALHTISYAKEDEIEEKLLGAIVKEPEPDEYVNVAQFDFSREYPSIIKGFNISPETYRDKEPEEPHYTVEYHGVRVHNGISTPIDFKCYFIKNPKGLLPQLILSFDAKRDEYQVELKKAIKNNRPESEIKSWERRQYNMKKTTNAIYGVMDYKGFRLHKKECTQATAILGRISIEELSKYLKSIDYELVYGDTDSIFIKLHETESQKMYEEGMVLYKMINEHLSGFFNVVYGVEKAPAEMSFKKIYNRILFTGKKNYAGREIWDEKEGWRVKIDTKGLSPIRSDNSILEKTTVELLLKSILNEDGDNMIRSIVRKTLKDYDDRKYDILVLAYPQQIKKRIWYDIKKHIWKTSYAHLDKRGTIKFPAHARAVLYGNQFLNTNYETGDKPRRLPILLPKKLKIEDGQQLLFGKPEEIPYPTEWIYKGRTGGIKQDLLVKLRDIPISEDYTIPEFFLNHIDYMRIRERLINKIESILKIHYKNLNKEASVQSILKC